MAILSCHSFYVGSPFEISCILISGLSSYWRVASGCEPFFEDTVLSGIKVAFYMAARCAAHHLAKIFP